MNGLSRTSTATSSRATPTVWRWPRFDTPGQMLTRLGVSLKRKTLNLVEMEDSTSLSVRVARILAY